MRRPRRGCGSSAACARTRARCRTRRERRSRTPSRRSSAGSAAPRPPPRRGATCRPPPLRCRSPSRAWPAARRRPAVVGLLGARLSLCLLVVVLLLAPVLVVAGLALLPGLLPRLLDRVERGLEHRHQESAHPRRL